MWLLLAAILCSFLGYKLAQNYGLSGLTGLTISSGLYFVFVTDTWLQFYGWLRIGDNLLKALSGVVLVACALLLAEKAKFFALVKVISLMAPVTATSVTLPQYTSAWMRGQQAPPAAWVSLWEYVPGAASTSSMPRTPVSVPPEAVEDHLITMARVSIACPLYDLKDKKFVASALQVQHDVWVLVLSEEIADNGETWLNVMLPANQGGYVRNDSPTGYLPLTRIATKVFLPAPR